MLSHKNYKKKSLRNNNKIIKINNVKTKSSRTNKKTKQRTNIKKTKKYKKNTFLIGGDESPGQPDNKPTYEFLARIGTGNINELGKNGVSNLEFNGPSGIAISSVDNRIYIADKNNHRVQVFKINENYNYLYEYVTTLGTSTIFGSDNQHFNYPTGVAISPDGKFIYVADTNNHRVQVFKINNTGEIIYEYVATIGTEKAGASNYDFDRPNAIAVSADNHIYVGDISNRRVQVFKIEDEITRKIYNWIATLKTNSITFIPHSIAIGANNRIYVGDTNCVRVFKISKNNNNNNYIYEYLKDETIGEKPHQTRKGYKIQQNVNHTKLTLSKPSVAFSLNDNFIYIGSNNSIKVLKVNNENDKNTYKYITEFVKKGEGVIEFNGLNSIAVSSNNLIYVTEHNNINNRVRVFKKTDLSSPSSSPSSTSSASPYGYLLKNTRPGTSHYTNVYNPNKN
jgi:DNA-binding beta-propeller fold protein YncE